MAHPSLKLYNSLSRQVEPFEPLEANKVKLYVCGPTVYDDPHLGHARCYLTWDVLYRLLLFLGYDVNYVRNLTDVDDKILNRALERGVSAEEVTNENIKSFHDGMTGLNLLSPTTEPRATSYVGDMVTFIETLIQKGFAYATPDGDVYYDSSKKADYGKLCQQPLDELQAGARVQVDEHKRSPLDFVLWKHAKPNEVLKWPSPWGNQNKEGRPGWHIECSTMIHEVLGAQIDIHAGGCDLIFPHHENEIAQSEAFTGLSPFVKCWMHNGFVNVSGEKMSKSLGNFTTLPSLLTQYEADTIRYFVLTNHYRMPVDFNDEALKGAQNWVNHTEKQLRKLLTDDTSREVLGKGQFVLSEIQSKDVREFAEQWQEAMCHDMNTAQSLAALNGLFKLARKASPIGQEAMGVFLKLADVMGFAFATRSVELLSQHESDVVVDDALREWVESQIVARKEARESKNWALADEIRQALTDKGVRLIDVKDAPTTWELMS